MQEDIDTLLRRLIGGDDKATAEVLDLAATIDTPRLLVAAAMITAQPQQLLARAARSAVTTRDRQLVAVAAAHLNGADHDLLDVLVREHLSDFPDNILAAWIAAEHLPVTHSTPTQPRSPHA